jgi:putative nucleotidyltransferase with HDIG domain
MANAAEQVKVAATPAASPGIDPTSVGRVLLVDKPRFARLLERMLEGHFEMRCAADGVEAVRIVREWSPDAIVCEATVRGGGTRLAEVLSMNADWVPRPFILTCIKPGPDLVDKAAKLGVSRVLAKPFPPSTLLEAVGHVVSSVVAQEPDVDEEKEADLSQIIRDRMLNIDGLPPFPATHSEIVRLANSDESDSDDVAEQIQMDPSFLATVLKLANSSHYGFSRKVDSLKLAVSLVGMKEIANLVMSLQVFKELGNYDSKSGFDTTAFWKHSVGTAFIARFLAKRLRAEVELCFMAGLLHDIGKVVLDRFFGDFFQEALALIQERSCPSVEAEKEVLGLTHTQVGGYLAVNWNFSDTLIESIVCHHDPSQARHYQKLASVVHVANAACSHLEYGSSGEVVQPGPKDETLAKALWRLGLEPSAFEKVTEMGSEQLEAADGFLSTLGGA